MTPQAANELLDLIMLDDFVERKKALDNWSRRWVATAEVILKESKESKLNLNLGAMLGPMRRAAALGEIVRSLSDTDAPPVLSIEKAPDAPGSAVDTYVARVYFLRQEPLREES